MAAVDSLLQIAREQRADGLVLATGEAPTLMVGRLERKLSMPALDDAMIRMLVDEISDTGVFEVGATEARHRCDAGSFVVKVHADRKQLRVEFVAAGDEHASPSVAPPPPPSPASPSRRPSRAPLSSSGQAAEFLPEGEESRPALPPPVSSIAQLTPRLLDLLQHCHASGASDLIVSADQPIRERTDGVLRTTDTLPVTLTELEGASAALGAPVSRRLAERGSADLAIELSGGERFRISVFRQSNGTALVARPIRSTAPTLESLRLPGSLGQLAEFKGGLVLVAGATGSGKSTTVVALVEHLNRSHRKHIITLEDPIEFRYASERCLIHQREIGADAVSFADGIRAALRASPDVIVVGEMRDPETIAAALTAAELGHLVISTIHSRGAAWALNRVIDGMPAEARNLVAAQLAGSLRAILTQTLVPGSCGGRVVAHELLLNNEAVSQKLREGNAHHVTSLIETNRTRGMRLMEDSLAELVRAGEISFDDALAGAAFPAILTQLVRGT